MTYSVTTDGTVFTTEDGALAAIRYIHDVVLAKRVGALVKTGHLPGLDVEVLASYPEGTFVHKDRTIMLNPGEEALAQRPVPDRDRTEALWYAKGFIACTGALSPFDSQSDPQAFADWYVSESGYVNVGQAWGAWTERRRAETGL